MYDDFDFKKFLEDKIQRNKNFFNLTIIEVAEKFWEIKKNQEEYGTFANLCAAIAKDFLDDLKGDWE